MPVLRAVRRFGGEDSPLSQLVPVVRPPLGGELRVDLLDLHGKELFPRKAERLARPVVDVDEAAVRPHPVGGFASPVDAELGEAQRDVRSFPVGDVEDEAVDPPQPPVRAIDHLATVRHPPYGTVPVQEAILEPEDALAGPHGLEDTPLQHALVLGVDDPIPRFPSRGKFLGGMPDDLLDVRPHDRYRPVRHPPVDHARHVVHEGHELKGLVPLLREDPALPYDREEEGEKGGETAEKDRPDPRIRRASLVGARDRHPEDHRKGKERRGAQYGEPAETIHGTRPPPCDSYRHVGEKSLPVWELFENNPEVLESAREAVYKECPGRVAPDDAGVVELADARDSKSRVRKDVRVQVPPPAPT